MNSTSVTANSPATRFGEAFPLGNGHLGAMVYGGTDKDRIQITENTFFSGNPSQSNNGKRASAAFSNMRKMILADDYEKAQIEENQFIGIRNNYGTNLPVGDLLLETGESEVYSKYLRTLNIKKGLSECSYLSDNNAFEKCTFLSHRDNCLVHEISSEKPFCLKIGFSSQSEESQYENIEEGMAFRTKAVETTHSDGKTGVSLFGEIRVLTDGLYNREKSEVEHATRIAIIFSACTDFNKDEEQVTKEISSIHELLSSYNKDTIEDLKSNHSKEMETLFLGSHMELNTDDSDSEKIPFLFHYGRYLLYSSSRSDSVLPAHLQGIWNDNVACRIGWTCDMHLDVNTQMNYWPAQVSNLAEVNEPLFSWVEKILVPQGRKTAGESYGQPGWAAELVSNAWGFAAPYWASPIAPCPGCGIWILTHFFEHFLYTEDRDFLRDRAYPLIKESVLFFINYIFQTEEGYYVGGPSISPENSFKIDDGSVYFMSNGVTFEVLMIRELFEIYLKTVDFIPASERDLKLETEVNLVLDNLLPYRILSDGTIAEWMHDFPAADPQHRHTSHLLGLYPFAQITPEKNPELAEAAGITITKKMTPADNWEDTGWARSLLILYEARLGQADRAYGHIQQMLQNLLEPNFMVFHPPTRGAQAFDNVYELDGNTGLLTGIAEMLLQSHNGKIQLLPALPSVWKTGRIAGLKSRGNIEISISWCNNILTEAILFSLCRRDLIVCYGGKELKLSIDGEVKLTCESF